MSFLVYLDESGITDPTACVVAGYAASSLRWSNFCRSWKRILLSYKVSEFHAEPFFKKDRLGLSIGNADRLLQSLLDVIARTKPTLVGTSIAVADFLALPEAKRRYLTGGSYFLKTKKVKGGAAKTPFHVAMQNTVIQAAKLAPKGEKANFICDEQRQYCAYVVERFNVIKKKHFSLPLGGISHVSSKEFLPLQAADLACYAAFQFSKERLKAGKLEASGILRSLIAEKNRFDYFDRALLEDWTEGVCEQQTTLGRD